MLAVFCDDAAKPGDFGILHLVNQQLTGHGAFRLHGSRVRFNQAVRVAELLLNGKSEVGNAIGNLRASLLNVLVDAAQPLVELNCLIQEAFFYAAFG